MARHRRGKPTRLRIAIAAIFVMIFGSLWSIGGTWLGLLVAYYVKLALWGPGWDAYPAWASVDSVGAPFFVFFLMIVSAALGSLLTLLLAAYQAASLRIIRAKQQIAIYPVIFLSAWILRNVYLGAWWYPLSELGILVCGGGWGLLAFALFSSTEYYEEYGGLPQER